MKIKVTLTRPEVRALFRRAHAASGYWGKFEIVGARLEVYYVKTPYRLTPVQLSYGVQRALEANNKTLMASIHAYGLKSEAWDIYAVDAVIQFALFGEVRFG